MLAVFHATATMILHINCMKQQVTRMSSFSKIPPTTAKVHVHVVQLAEAETQRLNKSRNLLLRAINIILHLQHFVMFAIAAAASRSDNVFASLTDSSFVRFEKK